MIIKICGITKQEDAIAAVDAGASALGFNFWPQSPRYLDPVNAGNILAAVPKNIWKVGVFVGDPADRVAEVARMLKLDVVQLHGNAQAPANLRIWRGWSVKENFHPQDLPGGAEAFLLDTPAGERYGGTGQTFDWNRLKGVDYKFLLAGGLDASNIAEAIRRVRPWGVDACSRLESRPGEKDHAKMKAFVEQAMAAANSATA